jgi:hypothetical protein
LPVLPDPKREKFAQLCARGIASIDAYMRCGYKRNTGNATAFRKRPDIQRRIQEIQAEIANNTEEELGEFLKDSGLTPTYIIRQMLDTAKEAKDAGKFDIAARTFKDIGGELFGMFIEKRHLTVDKNNSVHTTTNTTINIEGLNQALESLAGPRFAGLEIDGIADRLEPAGAILAPEPLQRE